MSDERKEAADITRSLRRYVERERALGGAELLADGAARAAREADGGAAPGAPAAGEQLRETAGRRHPGDADARPRPAPPSWLRGSAESPSAAPPPPAHPERSTPEHIATNLFGEPEAPTAASTKRVAQMLDEPLPDMFAEGLSPGGLEARAGLAADALPVLATIAGEVRVCTQCGLCDTRTQAVPGVGTARSGIVFVGEAPGADEDRLGEPFVGRAGQLLDRIIKAMDDARMIPGLPLNRETVYICNVLKCRPPENRNPLPHEIERCSPYLRRQLETIQPRVICCLGKFAAELLVGVKGTIAGLRGKVYRYQGAKLIVTYHPAACLRNPDYKRPVWEDMQLLAREYLSD